MTPENSIRPEIQGLRAIAVGLVVIFHIWPWALPGGFIGVDVFFVISGYLITGQLVRIALHEGHISLVDFYSRRIRRLLPAATAVLITTFAGTFIFLPQARWQETSSEIAASALYVQNWVLASLSVDYLGAENAASPVQHFWSLSIEEQFYVVWPLVMIFALAVSRRLKLPIGPTLLFALSAIFVGSLIASFFETIQQPAQAYFVTHTRVWELALGGLLALSFAHHQLKAGDQMRVAMCGFGLTAIIWSAFAYSGQTPFPGLAALVPTMGTILIITAGDIKVGFFRGLNVRWLSYLGDRSYSIYLWHWPLIVFYAFGRREIGLISGLSLVALTLAISHLSYKYIEQRFRRAQGRSDLRPFAYAFISIFVCVGATGALQYNISSQAQIAVAPGDPSYPGPAALLSSAPVPADITPIPPLAALRKDLPIVYRRECHQSQRYSEPVSCTLGNPNGAKTVVVAGDSHAAQWVPALRRVSEAQGWKLVTLTKSACALSRVDVLLSGKLYESCLEWRERAVAKIKKIGTDVLFVSQSSHYTVDGDEMADGLRSVWTELTQAGVKVVAIQDTPWMPFDSGDCLASKPEDCTAPRRDVEAGDVFYRAAKGVPGVEVIDLVDGICGANTCESIVGNMIVRRDEHHLTATYAAALAPFLAQHIGVSAEKVSKLGSEGRTLFAELRCSSPSSEDPVVRALRLYVEDGTISHRFGDWENQKERYDLWTGTIQGSVVSMTGHYREGKGGVKDLSLSGRVNEGQLLLDGTRGPRECQLKAAWRSERPLSSPGA